MTTRARLLLGLIFVGSFAHAARTVPFANGARVKLEQSAPRFTQPITRLFYRAPGASDEVRLGPTDVYRYLDEDGMDGRDGYRIFRGRVVAFRHGLSAIFVVTQEGGFAEIAVGPKIEELHSQAIDSGTRDRYVVLSARFENRKGATYLVWFSQDDPSARPTAIAYLVDEQYRDLRDVLADVPREWLLRLREEGRSEKFSLLRQDDPRVLAGCEHLVLRVLRELP